MAYKRIKKKTYNNVMYLARIIQNKKGYPIREAANIALNNFSDFDNSFNYCNVETMINNLVSYQESLQRKAMHEYNMTH